MSQQDGGDGASGKEQALESKVSYNDLDRAPSYITLFNALPSPSYLLSLGNMESPACLLCMKEEPWSTSPSAVQKPWVRGAIDGTMTKCPRPWQTLPLQVPPHREKDHHLR